MEPVSREFLKSVEILEDLSDAQLDQLMPLIQAVEYEAGDVVCQEGSIGEEMFIIYKGCIDISKEIGKQSGTSLVRLQHGELLGELAYFDREPRSATACAFVPSVLLTIKFKELKKLLDSDPLLASRIFVGVIRTLSRRLRQADEGIRNLFQRMVYY